ncbi:hypothetical protein EWB00_001637 [Schistosoma japonicum]|uniref:Uncharacterized protein n=1 Tax=Schistosoma japonicum TaxID=6182 RepID=A0A4Z2CK39_SCHJA|nr:hypothetical protein EWB00_001637 [Schistosoma japonicum]
MEGGRRGREKRENGRFCVRTLGAQLLSLVSREAHEELALPGTGAGEHWEERGRWSLEVFPREMCWSPNPSCFECEFIWKHVTKVKEAVQWRCVLLKKGAEGHGDT